MKRSSWDRVFLEAALAAAGRSECVRSQVGAVIVDAENVLIATGYNGKPQNWSLGVSGSDRGCAGWCPRGADPEVAAKEDCLSIHAEANALLFTSRRERRGGTIYITRAPCRWCAKLIANSALERVVWLEDSDDDHAELVSDLLRLARVRVQVYAPGQEVA